MRAFPDISAEWLLMGEGEPLKEQEDAQLPAVPFFDTDGYSDNDVPLSAIKMCYRVVAVLSVRQF